MVNFQNVNNLFFAYFSTYQFLQQFNDVAQHNDFFDPGFQPEDMDEIPGLYQTIIDDPAALHDRFLRAKGGCYTKP